MSANVPRPESALAFQPPRPGRRSDWLLIAASVVTALLLVALAVHWTPQQDYTSLTRRLARWVVWDLRLISVLLLVALAASAREWQGWRATLPTRPGGWLLGIAVLGLILTAWVAPRTNRLYYDEHIYQNVGQNIAYQGLATVCNEGVAEYGQYRCEVGEYNKQPAGWPFLLSVWFQLFGIRSWSAHLLNNLLFAAGIFLMFHVAMLLFESARGALFAALLWALIPLNLLWFNTASSEPSAACAALFAVGATVLFARRPAHATCALALLANAWAIQFRPESLLLLAVNALFLALLNPRLLREPRLYVWGLCLTPLFLPHLGHLLAVRGHSWGSDGDKFSLAIVATNLPVNGGFYWDNDRFPVLFTLLALAGLLWRSQGTGKLALLLWFVLFWGIFLFFYAGSYNYGVDSRFSLVSYAPLALLAGAGCEGLLKSLQRRLRPAAVTGALAALIFLCWMPFLPLVRAVGEEAWAARADVEAAREFARHLPENSIVLTHNPNMFLLIGKNAAQMSVVTYNQAHVDQHFFRRFDGGVYLHWNYWCNTSDPLQVFFGENILNRYGTTLIAERQVRNFRFALYRLEPPPPTVP